MWLIVWFLSARPKKLLRAPKASLWQQGIVREAAPVAARSNASAASTQRWRAPPDIHHRIQELRNCSRDTGEKRLGRSCHFAINLQHAAHAGFPGKLFALLRSEEHTSELQSRQYLV